MSTAQVLPPTRPGTGTAANLQRSTPADDPLTRELEQQIAIARRFPRSVTLFRSAAIDLATSDTETAAQCLYALPRGEGGAVEGPSIRLAEIVQSAWGNSIAAARIVSEDDRWITAQGFFHDLQSNSKLVFDVQRRITTKHGKRFSDDMIGVTANAARSIALRQAIFQGIPRALWWPAYEACRKTIAGDQKSLANRRTAALTALAAFGVTLARVCAVLGVRGDADITGEHLVTLRGLYAAIKDGEVTPEDAFPLVTTQAAVARQAAESAPPDAQPIAVAQDGPAEPPAPEVSDTASDANGPPWDANVPERARPSWDDGARDAIAAFEAATDMASIAEAQEKFTSLRSGLETKAGVRGKWLANEIAAAETDAIERFMGQDGAEG